MSIETLLTAGLAATILVVAALLRLSIVGLVRFAVLVAGRAGIRTNEAEAAPADRRPHRRPRTRERAAPTLAQHARAAAGAIAYTAGAFVEGLSIAGVWLGGTAIVIATAFVEGLWIAAVGLGRAAHVLATSSVQLGAVAAATAADASRRAARALRPTLLGASRASTRRIAAAGAWTKPRLVVAVATLQHLSRGAVEGLRGRVAQLQEERQARPGEPASAVDGPRVIDLERDFDPLTDEFPEDRVPSSSV